MIRGISISSWPSSFGFVVSESRFIVFLRLEGVRHTIEGLPILVLVLVLHTLLGLHSSSLQDGAAASICIHSILLSLLTHSLARHFFFLILFPGLIQTFLYRRS